jgi:Zn finger protein HypA/HybF involved in hydrogenase expression
MDILPSYSPHIARRSCFAKHFSKTYSTPSQNPLHQHSHNRSCQSHSQSPNKRTLNTMCPLCVSLTR